MKKIFFGFVVLISAVTLFSCNWLFGDAFNDNDYISGYVYGDVNNNGEQEVVPGIKVTGYEGNDNLTDCTKALGQAVTDANGYFCIRLKKAYAEYDFHVTLEDIDGEKNGSFKTTTVGAKYMSFYLTRSDAE